MARPTYTARVIVVRKTKLGESDLILTLLAEDGSQLRAVAKGARKPKSSFASRLELFSVADVLCAKGRSLDVVSEARLVEGNAASLDPKTGAFVVRFDYAETNGLTVRKTFTVDPKAFTIHAVIDASIGGAPANVAIVMGPGPGDVETSESSRYIMGARANLYREGKVERYDAAALDKQPVKEGALRWAGVDDHYFMSAVLARTGNVRVEYAPRRTQDALGKTVHTFVGYTANLPGQGVDATFFLGLKERQKPFDALGWREDR